MSWKATVYVSELLKCPDGTPLTRDGKLLLFLLADHHNVSDEESRPSVITLAKEALMSERHARDLLRWFEKHGVIECIPGNGRGHTSSYCFVELKKGANMVPPLFDERRQKGGTKGAREQLPNKEDLGTIKPKPLNIPDWLPVQAWTEYEVMRAKIKKPMTERSMELAIAKLDSLRRQGHDPTAVLEQSIFNSWQGLFPVKETTDAGRNSGKNFLEELRTLRAANGTYVQQLATD
jgi:hypothetical protein